MQSRQLATLVIAALLGAAPWLRPAVAAGAEENLVRNPGFEVGKPGELPSDWGQQLENEATGTVALVDTLAHTGKQSLRIEHTNDKGYIHPNHELTLPPGVYAYRLWARSDTEIPFEMQVYDTRSWGGLGVPDDLQVNGMTGQQFSLRKDTWQRCEMVLSVTAAFPASLQIGLRKPGKLWLDDVEIVPIEPLLVLCDTGITPAVSFTAEEVQKRAGWNVLRDRATPIAGAAWLGNRSIGVAFRKGAPAAEFYAMMPGGAWKKLTELTPAGAGGDRAKAIRSFRVRENYLDEIVLDVSFETAAGKSLVVRYRMQQNRAYIETEAREGAESVVATCGSAFAVVPDWFGGDLVVNAAKTAAERVRFPRENQLLQLVEGGDAILAFVWLSSEQNVTATLAGEGEKRVIAETELGYCRGQRGNVWVGALTAPGIWRQKRISELTDMKGNKVGSDLPFAAQWRVDFRRQQDGLIDSWVPTSRRKDGNWEYCRDNGSRTMWTSCRDDLVYPAFTQDNGLYLVNTTFANAMQHTFFRGADDLTFDPADVALAYPYERSAATPADVVLVNDLLQQTLEETPAFQLYSRVTPVTTPSHRYPATCAITAEYEKAFEQGAEQKQRRKLLEDLRRMDYFVTTKRERIEEYMTWMRAEHGWLLRQKAESPALAPLVDRFDLFLTRLDDTYHKGRGPYIKTTADAMALADQVEALIDSPAATPADQGEPAGKFAKAQELGKQTRSIGGAQDAMVGYMRQIVKELRQTAGYAMLQAKDEAEFACAREMRQRTLDMLWQTNGHEWR
jgi:hypothetical protein